MAKRKSGGTKKPDAFPYTPGPGGWVRYPSCEWVDPDEMLRFFNEIVDRMPADERESQRVVIDAIRRAIWEQRFLLREKRDPVTVRDAEGSTLQ